MNSLRISPYVHFIEDHLSNNVHYGVLHRLTGEVFKVTEQLRDFLRSFQFEDTLLFEEQFASSEFGDYLRRMRAHHFVIPVETNPLEPFKDYYLVRPIQNPAIAYRSPLGELIVARTSMENYFFSPEPGELPQIIEEVLPPKEAELYLFADGTRTLSELAKTFDKSFDQLRLSLDSLTLSDKQLVKVAPPAQPMNGPYQPHNSVPRNRFHAAKWQPSSEVNPPVIEFHRQGIENADWEFDWIEPTLNHAYRFASEVLRGRSYPGQFCLSTLNSKRLPFISCQQELAVLEVGGGTGSFARGFLEQAVNLKKNDPTFPQLKYHIVELSPELMRNQQALLEPLPISVTHFHQDAVNLNLPGRKFELIISNEVIADFPVAIARRTSSGQNWEGDGGPYVTDYDLPTFDAPENFAVHFAAFEFIRRCWDHLTPSGTAILTEYAAKRYPKLMQHLSHDEWSIQFEQLFAFASKIGFRCELINLKEFLELDDEVLMLNGSAEQIFVLNYVLNKFNLSMPYAAISKNEFEMKFGEVVDQAQLIGITYSPLKSGFHYGPDPNQFKVLVMTKP
jgi:Putative S-adenosyl-L-methionine-dependent methyltransferase